MKWFLFQVGHIAGLEHGKIIVTECGMTMPQLGHDIVMRRGCEGFPRAPGRTSKYGRPMRVACNKSYNDT